MDTNYYLVSNKDDDYGNCRIELVETTQELSRQYYWYRDTVKTDIRVLKKYFDIVPYSEEKKRTRDSRYYGGE